MQKEHRLIVRAEPRLAVAEHLGAFRAKLVARRDDVVYLVAEVMHPARRVALENLEAAFPERAVTDRSVTS